MNSRLVETETERLLPVTAYLDDGFRIIDFVLVYKPNDDAQMASYRQQLEHILKRLLLKWYKVHIPGYG